MNIDRYIRHWASLVNEDCTYKTRSSQTLTYLTNRIEQYFEHTFASGKDDLLEFQTIERVEDAKRLTDTEGIEDYSWVVWFTVRKSLSRHRTSSSGDIGFGFGGHKDKTPLEKLIYLAGDLSNIQFLDKNLIQWYVRGARKPLTVTKVKEGSWDDKVGKIVAQKVEKNLKSEYQHVVPDNALEKNLILVYVKVK